MVLFKMMLRREGHNFVREDLPGGHGFQDWDKTKRGCFKSNFHLILSGELVIAMSRSPGLLLIQPLNIVWPCRLGICSSTCSSQAQGNTQARQQVGSCVATCCACAAGVDAECEGNLTSAAASTCTATA